MVKSAQSSTPEGISASPAQYRQRCRSNVNTNKPVAASVATAFHCEIQWMRFASSRKQRSHRFSAGTCSTICGSPNSLCVHIRSPSAQKASEGTAAAISGVSRTKKKRSGFLDIAIDALDAQFRCDRWGKEEIKIVAARPIVIAPVGVMQPQSDYALFARRRLVAFLKKSLHLSLLRHVCQHDNEKESAEVGKESNGEG